MTSSTRSFDASSRLTLDELKGRLDDIFYLDVVGRSYEYLLDLLSLLPRAKQEFGLHWGKVAARSDVEVGYLVIEMAPEALRRLGAEQARQWAIAALDAYDSKGMRAATAALRDIEAFAQARTAMRLTDIEQRLTRFAQGLAGRCLRVAAASGRGAWTDTATLHLPPEVDAGGGLDRYKALVALLWGQIGHGTFAPGLEAELAAFGDPARAAAWLAQLEALRLAPMLMRDLPGLAPALRSLIDTLPDPVGTFSRRLSRPEATVADSLRCLPGLMAAAPPDDTPLGALQAELARRVRAERVAQETLVLRRAIAGALAALGKKGGETAIDLSLAACAGEIRADGEVLVLPPEGCAAAQALLQDLGEIPPECMTPAGPGEWTPTAREGDGAAKADETAADALYDEWDYRRQAYRRRWCHLHVRDMPEGDAGYVVEVRRRHLPLIRGIRRRFEALRGEDRTLRRQVDGTEIDIDALVGAIVDRHSGFHGGERVFMRRQREERSLAAAFMVDMSGSTKGWVNEAEREALVMLCEALEALGDRYSIWGFSGWTRARCDLYRIKTFADRYDAAAMRRIAAIEAKDYTRMGPPLRHLTRELLRQPARHRLLVTLSDGRPDDFGDEYRGRYGIEDTRQALLEARQQGVRAYCVTIDRHGADYLRRMYGPASFTVLDDVRKLPLRIADIYRKLTS